MKCGLSPDCRKTAYVEYGINNKTLIKQELRSPPLIFRPSMTSNWQSLASDKKRRQHESIPTEWLVSVPPEDVLQVIGFPEECGLLSDQEVEITNTGVDRLLEMLATGEWSAVEVTTAFYKRAIIAQQVVRVIKTLRSQTHFLSCHRPIV